MTNSDNIRVIFSPFWLSTIHRIPFRTNRSIKCNRWMIVVWWFGCKYCDQEDRCNNQQRLKFHSIPTNKWMKAKNESVRYPKRSNNQSIAKKEQPSDLPFVTTSKAGVSTTRAQPIRQSTECDRVQRWFNCCVWMEVLVSEWCGDRLLLSIVVVDCCCRLLLSIVVVDCCCGWLWCVPWLFVCVCGGGAHVYLWKCTSAIKEMKRCAPRCAPWDVVYGRWVVEQYCTYACRCAPKYDRCAPMFYTCTDKKICTSVLCT